MSTAKELVITDLWLKWNHHMQGPDALCAAYDAGYAQAIEDAAKLLEGLALGDIPTDRQIGYKIGADAIRELAKLSQK